jgi:hypothetical protein
MNPLPSLTLPANPGVRDWWTQRDPSPWPVVLAVDNKVSRAPMSGGAPFARPGAKSGGRVPDHRDGR